MPGTLVHSPAAVIRKLLVDMGLGTEASNNQAWPVFYSGEPDTPDSAITVYDTGGTDSGRTLADGERAEFHGIQVRIRSASHTPGYTKARQIAHMLDTQVFQDVVTIGSTMYRVQNVSRTSDVLALGKETPTSKRSLFTVNALATVREI